jgi:molecular chaperone DnaK
MLGEHKENQENTFAEFKRTMGTDQQYYSSRMGKYYSSEALSGEILKALKSFVRDEAEPSTAVITVPADFRQVQIDATQKAAEMAGFEHCELLQEPIAASLAYGFDRRNIKGHWLVFDFGGGTFDAALVKMDEGIMTVVDHGGDNHLGGKDMDWLIVDDIIIPHLREHFAIDGILENIVTGENLRCAWKFLAEYAKIQLSTEEHFTIELEDPEWRDENGKVIDADIKIERSHFEQLIAKLIARAIRITKDLIIRNHLSPEDLETILLVGGPTYIPYLREKIKTEISQSINVTIDPMTVVTKGAAIFASTRSIPEGIRKIEEADPSKIRLILGYPPTTLETEVSLGLKVDRKGMEGSLPRRLFTEIIRSDRGWATGKIEIMGDAVMVGLQLLANTTNSFAIQLYDEIGNKVGCKPDSLSILNVLNGIIPPKPTLSHDIGISAVREESTEGMESFAIILKKNQTLPATGRRTFWAPKMLRPGNPDDILEIIVWEGESGTKPSRNDGVGIVKISGDRLAALLPERSELEITLKMDESRRISVSAYIPHLDETFEKVLNTDYRHPEVHPDTLEAKVKSAEKEIQTLREQALGIEAISTIGLGEIEAELNEIKDMKEKGIGDRDRRSMINNKLNELFKRLDKADESIKWPRMEKETHAEISVTKEAIDRYGTERDSQILDHLDSKIDKALELKDSKLLENTVSELKQLKWSIWFKQPDFWISTLKNVDECFNEIHWTDRIRARNLLNEGKTILSERGYTEDIESIVRRLWELMPEDEIEKSKAPPQDDIPHY